MWLCYMLIVALLLILVVAVRQKRVTLILAIAIDQLRYEAIGQDCTSIEG